MNVRPKLTREQRRAYSKAYYRANKHKWRRARSEKQKARDRARYAADPETRLAREAARKLGISLAEALAARKVEACEVCRAPLVRGQGKNARHLDHSHATGRFRGVLCSRCNLTLGLVEDSTELLEALAVYLRRRA